MDEALRDLLYSLQHNGIGDPRVLSAIARIPRELFISEDALKAHAYADQALPIECDQTISQPYIVAYMSERLNVASDQDVLEIGTGSGYQTAILSQLARHVYTIERHRELHDLAVRAVRAARASQYYGDPSATAPRDGLTSGYSIAFLSRPAPTRCLPRFSINFRLAEPWSFRLAPATINGSRLSRGRMDIWSTKL